MMGLTPIAGQNDDNEVFSTANASTLEGFAATNGVGELSFWEVDGYDKPAGYPYSKIFNAITGGGSSGGGPGGGSGGRSTSTAGAITGYGGLCLDVNAAGTANGTTVDLYDCNGTGAQVWQPQSNGALLNPASGKCLDDTGWSATSGTQAQIWSCTGAANQSWKLP